MFRTKHELKETGWTECFFFFENHVSGKIQAKLINDDLNELEPSKILLYIKHCVRQYYLYMICLQNFEK